ncbi:hypothetical protein HO173_010996 [Letharia columbiana]|uniref:Uncharacterized protein n=1 Tax=Letharia columbiana TaxID=112416 RepID=A0A8H6L0C9_9LECA|nr:uncharacterized protein HO173_010996 [Letharia columbiana]KAF6230880.1 hypothetical protein HO173_010996 [Letharia columbiana]
MDDRSIGRTDLVSPISEPNSPDPVLESYFRQQLEQLYADPSQALATNDGTEVDQIRGASVEQVQTEDREEYDFRLFTRPHASGTASVGASNGPQRIAIRSPSPAGGESGFTSVGRPDKYYFAGDTGAELAQQYARAAVSGQDIVEGLKMRWRGMELPWRVTVIKTTESGNVVGLEHQLQAQTNRRKRSGKKRRVVIRKRVEARAAKEVVARQYRAEKEAAEREKRTQKNREKKIKKRQKDRLKKVTDVQDSA